MGVTPAPMRGRTTSLCRVYLCGYANGRQTLQVASSDPRVVVPATFQIGNGQIVGDFQVRAGAIAATTYVTITVTLAGESKSQIVRIDP
jgi:hypothetical protein